MDLDLPPPTPVAKAPSTAVSASTSTSTRTTNVNEIKFEDGYQYDAVCPHDNLHFSSVKDWKNHHIEKHMDTKWKCPICSTVSASWHNYSYHVQIQEHGRICPPPWICKLKLPSKPKQNIKSHSTVNMNLSHSKDPKLCEKRFGSKYQLLRHIKSEHTNYRVINKSEVPKKRSLNEISQPLSLPVPSPMTPLPTTCVPALPLPSIGYNSFGAANMPSTITTATAIPMSVPISAPLSTPPFKKRRIYETNTSISPISPSVDVNNVNNDNKAKQVSFLNTLLKAAAFVENEEDSTNNTSTTKNKNKSVNKSQSNNSFVPDSNNMAMGISNTQQMDTNNNNNSNNNNQQRVNMNMPILGQMNMTNLNGLVLPTTTTTTATAAMPLLNGNNNAKVQYVAMPPSNDQIIYTTRGQLASLMNGSANNQMLAFQQQHQMVPMSVNVGPFGMNNVYPTNNVCFQSFVQPNVQNFNLQQQMLMTQNIAPVQNVNILQSQRQPQTQFVFFMNDHDKSQQNINTNAG